MKEKEKRGTADWRVRTGPRNKPTARERENEATHMPFRDWCTLHDGQRSHSSPRVEVWECGLVEETNHRYGLLISQDQFYCGFSDDTR